jgi:glycosyltransferase involved in cell wall biosynthesis
MDILKKNLEELALRANVASDVPKGQEDIRVLLVSTHIYQVTGYSKVSYNLVKQISNMSNVKLIHYGFQKYVPREGVASNVNLNRKYPANVEEIDASALCNGEHGGFGFNELPMIIRSRKPHIIILYNDSNIVGNYLKVINSADIERTFKIWVYADQIYTIQNRTYIDALNKDADRIFAFSTYWRDILKKQGINRPIGVINHGFEPDDFKVLDVAAERKKLGLPEKALIFMSLNRNQPRKRLDLLVMAFAKLVCKHPQKPVFMVLVCDKGEKGGWNLFEMYAREVKLNGGLIDAVGNRLMITNKDMSYTDDEIVSLYNCADIGVSCAEGEGWGLCSFEMMGVGKPQVVSDVGGHKEFCANDVNSLVVPVKSRYYLPHIYCELGGEAFAVDVDDFSRAMETYVMDSELVRKHGVAAREKVLGYSWEKVTESLKKCISAEVEAIKSGDFI